MQDVANSMGQNIPKDNEDFFESIKKSEEGKTTQRQISKNRTTMNVIICVCFVLLYKTE